MKITPLEIRQKEFEKVFRGYDKDEVNAFLKSLSQQWEKLIDENKELKIKLEASEKEIEKLREVESSLFKTLKTAEDTGANMIDQANKTAELHMKETQIKAEAILSEAKSKAKEMMEEAENTAKISLADMEDELKELGSTYKEIENIKDNLLDELKVLINDTLEKVNRSTEKFKKLNIEGFIKKVKARADEKKPSEKSDKKAETKTDAKKGSDESPAQDVISPSANEKEIKEDDQSESPQSQQELKEEPADKKNSFFDDIK